MNQSIISQAGNWISTFTGSSRTPRVHEGHLGLEEERSHSIGAGVAVAVVLGSPPSPHPAPQLAAMSQHTQALRGGRAPLFTGGSGNPVSVGGAGYIRSPLTQGGGVGPAPPWTCAGGVRADETCSVYEHATWPASCSLKPSRCTRRPRPRPELVPPSGMGGGGGSGNSRGDWPGAGKSPHVPSLPGCLC